MSNADPIGSDTVVTGQPGYGFSEVRYTTLSRLECTAIPIQSESPAVVSIRVHDIMALS